MQVDVFIDPLLYWTYFIVLILFIIGLCVVGFLPTPGPKEWEPE